ncbi:MAG: proprotein convertase P-domain-containing protein [Gammaproteobacteria bacterium]
MIDFIIKLGLYIALGILLALANFWYFRSIAFAFFTAQPPKSIAPFDVVGKEDPNGKLGAMLARQLQEKLHEIGGTMTTTRQKLETRRTTPPPGPEKLRPEDEDQILPQVQFTFAERFLSVKESALLLDLFNRFDLSVSVGGIDVGGLLAWLQSRFSNVHILHIGLEYKDNQVRIVGDDFPSSDVNGTDTNSIIERIAYSMVQQEVGKEFPGVLFLTPDEFRRFTKAFERFANLYAEDLRRQEQGAPWMPGQYRTLLAEVTALQEKAPNWKPLLRLNATLAEMTGDARQAYALYRRELELTDAGESDHDWISDKLAALEATIVPDSEIKLPRLVTGMSLHQDKSVMKALRETLAARRLLSMIGADVPVAQQETHVAVLGGLPWGQEGAATGQAAYIADYVETLAQVVKLVTPSTRLLFEPLTPDNTAASGYITDREIIPSLEKLIEARPEVLLIAVGPLLSPKYVPIFERAMAQGTLVVLAAGNQTEQSSQPFIQPQLVENSMIVSAATLDGIPAPYSPTGAYLYWAPGEQIPVYNPDRRTLEQRAGTGYAAAVAAGIVARVMAEKPDLDPIEILDILRTSAVQLKAGTGVKVLHLQDALEKVRVAEMKPGELFEQIDRADLKIPDGEPKGIRRTIHVDTKGRLLDIRVQVEITHTYIGDLRVWLTSPQGRLIVLHDRQGGSKDNLIKEYGPAAAPQLSELIGTDISGDWSLSVADMTKLDVGQLKRWSLKLRYQ